MCHCSTVQSVRIDDESQDDDNIMSDILDDKSEHCVPFIIEQIKAHQAKYRLAGQDAPPFFIGLNGVQGAGKTTLVIYLSLS